MTIFHAIFLGILQGLTEFLPVSSTAHLLIAEQWLGLAHSDTLFSFTVLIQLGTLLAVIVYFWADLWAILRAVLLGITQRKPFAEPQARLGWYLVIATLPAVVAGVLLKPLVEQLFARPALEAVIRLGLTIVFLLAAEFLGKRNRNLGSVTWLDALWVGIFQVFAVFPGASRSGSTIAGGMLRGLDRPAAARFAFLISVPVMLGAGLVETLDLFSLPDLGEILPAIAAGFIAAAVVGFLAIHWLLKFLARHPLTIFAGYCALLGVVALLTLKG